jgi:hypothetical protein
MSSKTENVMAQRLRYTSIFFVALATVGIVCTSVFWSTEKANGSSTASIQFKGRVTFTDSVYRYLTETARFDGTTIDTGFFYAVAFIFYFCRDGLITLHLWYRKIGVKTGENKSFLHRLLRYQFFTERRIFTVLYISTAGVLAITTPAVFGALGMQNDEFIVPASLLTFTMVMFIAVAEFMISSGVLKKEDKENTTSKAPSKTGGVKEKLLGTLRMDGWGLLAMAAITLFSLWIPFWTVAPRFTLAGYGNWYWLFMSIRVFWVAFLSFPILWNNLLVHTDEDYISPFWQDFVYRLVPYLVLALEFAALIKLGSGNSFAVEM